jgi:hypothetical protein
VLIVSPSAKVLFLLYLHRYLGELGDLSLIKVVKAS